MCAMIRAATPSETSGARCKALDTRRAIPVARSLPRHRRADQAEQRNLRLDTQGRFRRNLRMRAPSLEKPWPWPGDRAPPIPAPASPAPAINVTRNIAAIAPDSVARQSQIDCSQPAQRHDPEQQACQRPAGYRGRPSAAVAARSPVVLPRPVHRSRERHDSNRTRQPSSVRSTFTGPTMKRHGSEAGNRSSNEMATLVDGDQQEKDERAVGRAHSARRAAQVPDAASVTILRMTVITSAAMTAPAPAVRACFMCAFVEDPGRRPPPGGYPRRQRSFAPTSVRREWPLRAGPQPTARPVPC